VELERAILVGVDLRGRRGVRDGSGRHDESLAELSELAESAGALVVDRVLQSRESAEAATLIGRGKVQELAALAASHRAGAVLFDHDLTPTQQRNLEDQIGVKVLDRTQLILDIFARRARTREGRLQVELAQLSYLMPRLTGHGAAMSRLGGGIGTRGPGETKLETDRRRIAQRIKKIKGDLEAVRTGRALHRKQRGAVPLPTIALVGYTNAGKSTLFNQMTRARVIADARMFATLDPTVRSLTLPSHRKALVSDTVGFIRRLPTTLVTAFRATLEEVTDATLILHIIDASAPEAAEQTRHVAQVLADIGAAGIQQILVLNKMDRVGDAKIPDLTHRLLGSDKNLNTRAAPISALRGEGIQELLTAVDEILPFDPVIRAHFRVPHSESASIGMLYDLGRVLETRYSERYCELEAEVSQSLKKSMARFLLR